MFFQGQTLNWTYLKNGWSDWCETKKRRISWILGELCDLDLWPHPWPWTCSFKVKVWYSLIWGMGLIDMKWKGCESIIHDHDHELWVTMVGWVDVPYSDWGDFRRRRAIDISSKHIEAETKWLPLARQHFQMTFFYWKCISFNSNFTEFISNGPINNISSLVQIMACCQPGVKPLSEPIMDRLPTHVCVTQPQWVNTDGIQFCILFSLRLCNHHNLSFGSETEDREAGT